MGQSPFLEEIRNIMRTKHYSIQTEKTYLLWIKRFILFNKKRHPKDLGECIFWPIGIAFSGS